MFREYRECIKNMITGMDISKEQEDMCQAVRELCEGYLNDGVFQDDLTGRFPQKKFKHIAQMGILGLPFGEEYGGLMADVTTTALMIQTLAGYCKDEGLVFSVCAQLSAAQIPLWVYGTKEQKDRYLKPLIAGDIIGCSVISEPEAGSDTNSMKCTVIKNKGSYTLQGIKTFATLASVANVALVYAKHPKGLKMLDISAFILEKGEYALGQEFQKTGLCTSPMSEIILNQTKASSDRLLGGERKAMAIFQTAMLWEKILMGAYHVGAMEQQYRFLYNYTESRKQFNRKLIEFEGVYSKLTDMRIRLETSKLLLYQVCMEMDRGYEKPYRAAMVKIHTADCKIKNSLDAVSLMGAYGYIKESLIEKQMRDSLAANLYSGTHEMQKKIISEHLGDYNE